MLNKTLLILTCRLFVSPHFNRSEYIILMQIIYFEIHLISSQNILFMLMHISSNINYICTLPQKLTCETCHGVLVESFTFRSIESTIFMQNK